MSLVQTTEVPRKILVVDDEEGIRKLLERILQRLPKPPPVDIQTASSAEDALDMLEQGRFHLVLTDFNMGGRDGIFLLATVRDRWPETSRILMTGYTDAEIEQDAREQGAVAAFIRKPWNQQDLLRIIAALLPNDTTMPAPA